MLPGLGAKLTALLWVHCVPLPRHQKMSIHHAELEMPPGRAPLPESERHKLAILRERLQPLRERAGSTIEALYAAQDVFSYVPPEAIVMVAEELSLPESQVFGVVTFYTMFSLEPQPPHLLRVCRDLSCHLAGAQNLIATLEDALGVRHGHTSPDGQFKVEVVSCLGLCDKQPAMLVNLEQHGPVKDTEVPALLDGLRKSAS